MLTSDLPTLREIGADVTDLQFRGSFAFVAQKGFPAKTVLRKVLTHAESIANPPHFSAIVTGATYIAEDNTSLARVYFSLNYYGHAALDKF